MGIRILYRVGERMLGIEEALLEGQPWQIFVEYDNGLQVWVNLHPHRKLAGKSSPIPLLG